MRTPSNVVGLVAIVGFAAACSGGGDDDASRSSRSELGTALGVDYAWARPSPAGLRADGFTFASRYLSYDAGGKNITRGEADALWAAGVDVVANWEASSTGALHGYPQGQADARAAIALATAAGMPEDRPIYFSVDFDVTASQQHAVDAYFDGVASVIGVARTGAYGGIGLVRSLFDSGKIAWGWQTYAWSYGKWDARAQVRQIQNNITAGGDAHCCDKDQAIAADFGQWHASSAGSPAPVPAIHPAPARPASVNEAAFQASTGTLWTVGNAGTADTSLGMAPGTSPSIASLTGGGFQVAFQANTTSLWTIGSAGAKDWALGMMPGTSPAICALVGGGFQVAFQANTGSVWTVGDAGNRDWSLGMMSGTSPSIACLDGGGFQVAFQANTGSLWTVGDAGNQDWSLGMHPTSSPSIAALPGNKFEVAFEANTTNLWTAGDAGTQDWGLGMYAGTSPSIAALRGGGFEIAFQANTTSLWTTGSGGTQDWQLGMMPGTSPSLAALPGGGFRALFEANTTSLWTAGTDGVADLQLGMRNGTSPSGS